MNLRFDSERFVLRPLEMSDVVWCVEMLTDPEVVRFVYGEDVPSKSDVVDEMPLACSRGAGGFIGIWAIEDKSSSECLGTAALLPMPVEKDDTDWALLASDHLLDEEIEIGYFLRRSAWGRGVATEAASRLVQFAFEQTPLTDIVGIIEPEHLASWNVLEKVGFVNEGVRRAYAEDCLGFRISKSGWAAGRI